MKLAAAQIQSIPGDVAQNIEKHLVFSAWAAQEGVDLIVFSELSLTGYEPELAQQLACNMDDARLLELQALSARDEIIICAGFPQKTNDKPRISMAVFQPSEPVKVYSKQYLHKDELPYFQSGSRQLIIELGDLRIAPAICYESRLPQHGASARDLEATIYLASVAKPRAGLEKAFAHYPVLCQEYQMIALMSNAIGPSDNFISGGQSGVWKEDGSLVAQLDRQNEGLLLFDTISHTAEVFYKTN